MVLPARGEVIEQKKLNFDFLPLELINGDIHYSTRLLSPGKVADKFPELVDLDSIGMLQKTTKKIFITKSIYVVEKPIGFFDSEQITSEEYLDSLLGDQEIKKLEDGSFKVSSGSKLTYIMHASYDSDDLSNLPSSRVVNAVTAVKKLDIISQSGSSTIFREMTKATNYFDSGISALVHIPLKENKTVIINYSMTAINPNMANKKQLKLGFAKQIAVTKKIIEDFSPKN